MKIGIFDSGLGGLIVMKKLVAALPRYDYVYLGDTKRVPYGNRSQATIYGFLEEAVAYLFRKNCGLIIVACNTASAQALRRIQQRWLPAHYPAWRVLGIIIPTVEEAAAHRTAKRVGILATQGTVRSGTYVKEFKKLAPRLKVFQEAAPLLVPLAESGEMRWAPPIVREYLKPLKKKKIDHLVLGCTHYPLFKSIVRKAVGKGVAVVSQDELLPRKLRDYLRRHPEMERKLKKRGRREFLVTDYTDTFGKLAKAWFGKSIRPRVVTL